MNIKSTCIVLTFITIDVILLIWVLVRGHTVALLNPKGPIALAEDNLIIVAISLMLVVAIPTVIFTFLVAWKYRESNSVREKNPHFGHSKKIEIVWWIIPSLVVLILGFLIWDNTHALDPYKTIASDTKPITIQVVALRWKWLFIYPKQNIATINYIQIPIHTPVNFVLTADGPMSSFWIPQLGGQMYAMTGMETHLHLLANSLGKFTGSSAEINGDGFSEMKFVADASSTSDFEEWTHNVQQSSKTLTMKEYKKIAIPSTNNPSVYFSLKEKNLYNEVINQFMIPMKMNSTSQPKNMDMQIMQQ